MSNNTTKPDWIPFSKPTQMESCTQAVIDSIQRGHMSGDAHYSKKCEELLKNELKLPVKMVSSASHALEMMGILGKIQAGDEVICPSFTFVSTANAFVLRGAQIKFADCDLKGHITIEEIQRLYSPKTKAIVTMNYAGNSPDYDPIIEFCKQKKIDLYEDAAQSIGASYKGRPLGSIGDFACYSFHETKNINCGEGGAFIAKRTEDFLRAEIIREKGTNRSQFLQGMVDKYTWVDVGSSYLLPEMCAAYLLPQLENLKTISQKRQEQWQFYQKNLAPVLSSKAVEIMTPPEYNQSNYHIFGMILPHAEMRPKFIQFMRERQIATPFHYVSLHQSPFGKKMNTDSFVLANTEKLSSNLVRLPLFHALQTSQLEYITQSALDFFKTV